MDIVKKYWPIFSLCGIFAFVNLFNFYKSKYYYVGSDIFYYFSLADSLLATGKIQNFTLFPTANVVTPQNGIVFIIAAFKLFSLDTEILLQFLPFMYFILYTVSFYPIYQITKLLGSTTFHRKIVALLYFCHWPVYRIQLIPVNDGIFNVLAFWIIWLILDLKKHRILPLIILASLSMHFRINTAPILATSILVNIWIKKFQNSIVLGVVLICTILVFKLFYLTPLFSETDSTISSIGINISYYLNRRVNQISDYETVLPNFTELFLFESPKLFLSPVYSNYNYLYLIFISIPLYYFYLGIRRNTDNTLFQISSIILSTYLFYLLLNIAYSNRYFMYSYILTILLVTDFFIRRHRFLIPLFIYLAMVISYSVYSLRYTYERHCVPSLLSSLKTESITLSGKPLLISQEPRHSYYYLGYPGLQNFPDDNQLQGKNLYIVGDDRFIENVMDGLKNKSNINFISRVVKSYTARSQNCALIEIIQIP